MFDVTFTIIKDIISLNGPKAIVWIYRWVCISMALVMVSGCSFSTTDLPRPLSVYDIPSPDKFVGQMQKAYPDYEREEIEKSFTKAEKQISYHDITKYDEWASYFPVRWMIEALELFPPNAYAWHAMGTHLFFNNHPYSAIFASQYGIESLQEWKAKQIEISSSINQLQLVETLNQSRYYFALGEYEKAIDAFEKMPDGDLDSFHKLDAYWLKARLYSALKDEDTALEMLTRAQAINAVDLRAAARDTRVEQFDYPRYFQDKAREAGHKYVEGIIHSNLGDWESATEAFQSAVKADPEFWDARYSLSVALLALGDTNRARVHLDVLTNRMSKKDMFRAELIPFTYGNLLFQEKMYEEAAKKYRSAIMIADKRYSKFMDGMIFGVKRSFPLTECKEGGRERYCMSACEKKLVKLCDVVEVILNEDTGMFAEAYNNLGNAYFEEWLSKRDDSDVELLNLAKESYEKAIESYSYESKFRAHANLGRVYWYLGENDNFLSQMKESLTLKPYNAHALETLFALALKSSEDDDIDLSMRSFEIVVDELESYGPPKYVRTHFGTWLEKIEETLLPHRDNPKVALVLEKVNSIQPE